MVGARDRRGRAAPAGPALSVPRALRRAARPGRRSSALGRRAKYLLADSRSGEVLVMHLGMTGRFLVDAGRRTRRRPASSTRGRRRARAHDHVVFHLSNGARVTYNDARRFGFMDLVPRAELADSPHFARPRASSRSATSSTARPSRALFAGKRGAAQGGAPRPAAGRRARQHLCLRGAVPRRPVIRQRRPGTLATRERQADAQAPIAWPRRSATVLDEAIAAGGSTLRDYAQADGELGYFQHRFRGLRPRGRALPDAGLRRHVRRIVQAGRSTFYCPRLPALTPIAVARTVPLASDAGASEGVHGLRNHPRRDARPGRRSSRSTGRRR